MAQRPVTLTDIVAGHVSLEIEGFDRIYLNGYVPVLQLGGQLAGFLEWRGFPIASPAALGKISQGFRAAVRRYAEGNQIPWVSFRKGDRKLDVMRPYLDAAERAGASKVVAIGEAREFQWVFDATRKDGPDGVPWFKFYRTERLVTCYYFYIHDRRAGPAFIKVCAYAPYPVKVWCNGHEIARRAALAEGIAVTPLANGFAATSDAGRLQELCDMIQAGTLRVFFEHWMSRLPLPLTAADRDHDCWWQLSMRQIEVSRTLVFDDPRRVRTVFEQLLAGNMNLGRPEHAEVIFGSKATRKIPGTFSTRLLNRPDQVTVNLSFKHSRIKIYLKEDRALRIESVINDPGDLGCLRGLEHLDELSAKARACNARLMDAVIAGQGSGILANPVIERIAHPTCDEAGRRVPAMRFADPRVQALAGCLAIWDFAVNGITNKSLRAWMTGLRGVPYSMNQASYDLARLRRNGLIERIARSNTYRLTPDGLTFALVYSRVHDQILYPLTAHDQPIAAPAPIRAAWRAITRHIDSTIADAHLGRAALAHELALACDQHQLKTQDKRQSPRALEALDATTLFTRLNVGRIPLTDAELVKALLLSRSRGGLGMTDRALEIAAQWDDIERDLRDPELWAFITGKASEDPTHISLLLDTIAGGPTGRDRPLFHTFETLRERIAANPQEFWNEVVDLHSLVLGWHESRDLFHKIGFLIAQGASFNALIERSKDKSKSKFAADLDGLIRDNLRLPEADLRELSYQSAKTSRTLLLMNVETIRQRKHSSERYSFREHAAGRWSLEHIHAQNAEQLNRAEQWKEWLRLHRKALMAFDDVNQMEKNAVLDRLDQVLASSTITEADFRPLERELTELLSTGTDSSEGGMDSIANLALLDGGDNSALSNSVFAVKRAAILDRDREGSYIPVCTRNVFLKYYSPADEHQMHFWSANDREHYLSEIVAILGDYLLADEEAAP